MKGFCAWPGKVGKLKTLVPEQADLSLCIFATTSSVFMHVFIVKVSHLFR